ncbi:hypothetical protein J6590_053519 [Homalodisca vitripennis]|nr:hypothetical protein J6590_053519 [Homalodisca vitripennis]
MNPFTNLTAVRSHDTYGESIRNHRLKATVLPTFLLADQKAVLSVAPDVCFKEYDVQLHVGMLIKHTQAYVESQ